MLTFALDDRALQASLDKLPPQVLEALRAKMTGLTVNLQAHVIRDKLSGQVLHQKSGALAQSIQRDVRVDDQIVVGEVFSAGNVKYAAIHEYGGVIHHPGGTAYIPADKGALMMFVSNADAKADMLRTKPHDIHMPERSFLRSSLKDQAQQIMDGLRQAALNAARKLLP